MVWPDQDDNTDAMFHGNPFGMGWKPQLPDHRDLQFSSLNKVQDAIALPPKVSLRPQITWRWDQGATNSCTAFSTCTAVKFAIKKSQNLDFNPSQLFTYYNTRKIENDTYRDSGAEIRDTFKSLSQYGVAPAEDWEFQSNRILTTPPSKAYTDAKKEILRGYYAVNQVRNELKSVIALGHPFVTGIIVFGSMVHSSHGMVPMPGSNEKPLGGHAVACIGYDDETQHYEFLNSWSRSWGDDGCFWLPYAFVESENYTQDTWMIIGK